MGRYDAVLTKNADGSCSLETVKSEEITTKLKAALEGREDAPAMFSDRGTGTNVLGFLTMFLLMMGSTCMTFYADDKTGGQITRIAASPLGISNYLFAHCLFNFLFLFIPTTIILVAVSYTHLDVYKRQFYDGGFPEFLYRFQHGGRAVPQVDQTVL